MCTRFPRVLAAAAAMLLSIQVPALAQGITPNPPLPADGSPHQHIFYGQVPPESGKAPVVVFVHGLKGRAYDWWVQNDMYWAAFNARYRTAFISMNLDNTPNEASTEDNALVLKDALPVIAAHYGVSKMYLVGHSKGGVDIQAAMLQPGISDLAKAVFTISTPNAGTELADWAFGPGSAIAQQLGLLIPGVASMQTATMAAFRAQADPVLRASGVPFYTITGNSISGHPITQITGQILAALVPGEASDGLVTVDRTQLPPDYSSDLGTVTNNHFKTDAGLSSWSKIAARISGMEHTLDELTKIASNGLGDPANTFMWSMAWFKGQLYVGTGREVQCISVRTADLLGSGTLYDSAVASGQCPPLTTLHRSLAAEIWRYTPSTGEWERVFKSPETLFAGTDALGDIYTARDVGFRGMTVITNNEGVEELWVGGVNSGTIFEHLPEFAGGFPPPRLLYTTNGTDWNAAPQTPGTFLGDIANPLPGSARKQRSFRALTFYNGKLFATVADYRGVGFIIASDDPKAGDNAWFLASPIPEQFPVWNITVFNNFLYVTTGDKELANTGYGLFKTDASGTPPYTYNYIVIRGGYNPDGRTRSPNGLSFAEFNGELYMGTNRPTELIRVRPDDTWDLLIGEPRMTPQGFKAPLTGLGVGFGSWFNGHFWRMTVHNGQLYLGTWDWAIGLRTLGPLDKMFGSQFGFDLFRTSDGVNWTAVTRTGLGDGLNFGVRTLFSTPEGLFLGSAKPQGGAQVFACRDASCAPTPGPLPAPTGLRSTSYQVAPSQVILNWNAVPGAVRYRVYRLTGKTFDEIIPGRTVAEDGSEPQATALVAILPFPIVQVGAVTETTYTEAAPGVVQSVYFVRAEDADGNLSNPSNFVGGPSKADAATNPLR
jgi:pimeloyl-ACP methyl ester carboxylesterase